MFKNLTTDALEKQEERLGSGGALETGVYSGKIKVAYAGKSKAGAQNVTLVLDFAGREYRETVYVTNRKGENYFLNKQDNTKKVPLPGFTLIDNICMLTTEKPLSEQDVEDKVVKLYDFDQKKEVPTSVPVLIDLLDKAISLAIIKERVNKNVKNDQTGEYEPTAEERDQNVIDRAFHTETKLTVLEAEHGLEEGEFWDKWAEKNNGVTRDKREIKDGQSAPSGRTGAPPKPSATPTAPKKSLFSKKA